MVNSHTEHLAKRLLFGVEALKQQNFPAAAEALCEVCDDEDLNQAADLLDIRARANALAAQALLELGDAKRATTYVRSALRLATTLGDQAGLVEVRTLNDAIIEALTNQRKAKILEATARKLIGTDPHALKQPNPFAHATVLLDLATAEATYGDKGRAIIATDMVIALSEEFQIIREGVLAHIQKANLVPDVREASLIAAWTLATDAHETNLVSAVARAATQHGISLAPLHGPTMATEDVS